MARTNTRTGLGGAFAVRLESSSDADILYDAGPKNPEGFREGNPGNVYASPKGELFLKRKGRKTKHGWERLVTEDEIKDLVLSDYSEQIDKLVTEKVDALLKERGIELQAQSQDSGDRVTLPVEGTPETEESDTGSDAETPETADSTPEVVEDPAPEPVQETAAQRKAREKAEKAAAEVASSG